MVMAEELHSLLHQAGISSPYLLVGHSLGGLTMRVFAHLYPTEVAGLVLVDAAHAEQYLPPVLQRSLAQMASMVPRMFGLFQLLVRTGIPALRPTLLPLTAPANLPAASAAAYRALYMRDPQSYATTAAELKAITQSHAQLRDVQPCLPANVPVMVIRHGQRQPQMTPEATDGMEQINARLQTALAASVPEGRLIVAERSGHDIPSDQPELVIAAIRDVLQTVRSRTLAAVA